MITLGQEQAPMPVRAARSSLFLRPSHLSGLVRFLPRAIVAFPRSSSNHFCFLTAPSRLLLYAQFLDRCGARFLD